MSDHYLKILKTKPGGLPGATALAHARAPKAFTSSHQAPGEDSLPRDGEVPGSIWCDDHRHGPHRSSA
jgi:hypothetical protein